MAKDLDELLSSAHLGQFGRYQGRLLLCLSLAASGVGIHSLLQVFTGASLDYVCDLDDDDHGGWQLNTGSTESNITGLRDLDSFNTSVKLDYFCNTEPKNATTARDHGLGCKSRENASNETCCILYETGNRQCFVDFCYYSWNRFLHDADSVPDADSSFCLSHDAQSRVTELDLGDGQVRTAHVRKRCKKWKYDTTQYKSSIVTEWDLVCSETWLVALAQSLHMVGCLVGCLVCGSLSDRFGRRKVLLTCTLVQIITGIGTAFVQHYTAYAALRLVTGIAIAGQYNSAFLIALEMVGPKWRVVPGASMFFFNSLGYLILDVSAYFIRDWRTLQLTLSAGLSCFVFYACIIPESPRWLIARGHSTEAARVLRKIARTNRKSLPTDLDLYLEKTESREKSEYNTRSYSILHLMKTRAMRCRTLILSFLWFSNSLSYYGLTMYSPNLAGNDYVNFALSSLVEIPACAFCLWALNRFGRRKPLVLSMLLAGGSLLSTGPLPSSYVTTQRTLVMVGKLGISVAFCSLYPFCAESFPTVIRMTGIGVCSTCARVGGFMAPFIIAMADVNRALPLLILGGMALVGGGLIFTIPETLGRPLPQTIEDIEDGSHVISLCCSKSSKRDDTAVHSKAASCEETVQLQENA